MKRLLLTLALTGVFSISAVAGDMHGDSAPVPSPTPQGMSATPSSLGPSLTGDIPTSVSGQPVLQEAWSALLTVFGLVV